MTTTMSEGPPKDEEDEALHIAMLSVYYRSLGSELESRGAPVMARAAAGSADAARRGPRSSEG